MMLADHCRCFRSSLPDRGEGSRFGILALVLVAWVMVLAACAKNTQRFIAPAQRPVAANEQPWRPAQFLSIAYHDVEDQDPDQRFVGIGSGQLVEQLNWLYENGYQAVSVDQVLAAHAGRAPLPEKSVLLSFDDGYGSFYTRVLPILKAWNWPAILAPVGIWMDAAANQPIDFGGLQVERGRFLNWAQIAEIADTGLVEIAAHSDRSHYGILANPQGNTQPAAAAHAWLPAFARYETDAEFHARMRMDVRAISDKIRLTTGKAPRVWVWPYGAVSGVSLSIVAENGYQMALTLEPGLSKLDDLMSTARVMPINAPSLNDFSQNDLVGAEGELPLMRVAHVDLDYIHDPDPQQTERNLGALVQRMYELKINTVFLQAFSDPSADGLARALYFPNRHLPMRADLFNRVAWQLRSRASVKIYAWMPVLAFDLDARLPQVLKMDASNHQVAVDGPQYRRLTPFDAHVRQQIGEIYEDLASHAIFDGLLFHDDAFLGDYEDASEPALAAYRAAGFDSIPDLHRDHAQMQAWSRFKSKTLIEFTHELSAKVRAIRGPQILTARNIYAEPVLNPHAEQWFAQNLDDFLAAYDWVAPMAMPRMENVPLSKELAWLDNMVDIIAARPGALDKTVFELQARDWRRSAQHPYGRPIDTKVIARWMQRLQLRGVRNFGYYPDDFAADHPRLRELRPAISISWYPFGEKQP